jgi:opacity protein-like surface antigen
MPRFVMAALATLLLAPAAAGAQLRPGPGGFGPGGARWTPFVGPRFGWSMLESSPSLGAQLRVPVPIPVVRPSITAGGDLVFQSGLRETQGTADLTTGVFTPLFVGGGPAVVNTIFEDASAKQTKTGFSIVAGVRGGRIGPLAVELEFRWMRVAERKPRFMMFSLAYPLRAGL